ncbi:HupE/UreJ family protein [Neiella marina]|uniref:HupE/UreJ family protein n=1 Tax=Neiella holothuriorum TaxID=2870530 RepID=A0ABS7EJI5_9GAMM|nr:HupE/UreJ family protein [Neiella holothuriorum]MBW8192499.1 HupE/UreJ family protein [Neiella holothuriorum]
MKPNKLSIAAISIASVFTMPVALAHQGSHATAHWYSGLIHPFTGLDHLITMLLIGVVAAGLSAKKGKQLLAMVGLSFVGGMLLANVVALPASIEYLLLASLVLVPVAGLCLGKHRVLETISISALALFGAAHGFVQTTEATGSIMLFGTGALLSSMALCIAGYGLKRAISAHSTRNASTVAN